MERNPKLIETSYAEQIVLGIKLLQGKWTIHILCAMRARSVRLSELRREIPSASKKALTASLRSLQAARVVVRRDLSSNVLHVEYELVDSMRAPLGTLLDLLAEWGGAYTTQGSAQKPVSIETPESPKI
jgi:DNA-binding HxlR family transcriptional regulator